MKNVGCKFAVNQTVENALDVFLMDIAALNAYFQPPVEKKTHGIKKLSEADEKRKELNHLIFQNHLHIFYENLHEITWSNLILTCKESEKLQGPKFEIK